MSVSQNVMWCIQLDRWEKEKAKKLEKIFFEKTGRKLTIEKFFRDAQGLKAMVYISGHHRERISVRVDMIINSPHILLH